MRPRMSGGTGSRCRLFTPGAFSATSVTTATAMAPGLISSGTLSRSAGVEPAGMPASAGSCANASRIATAFMNPASTGCGRYFTIIPRRRIPMSAWNAPERARKRKSKP
jgi:hypothetical protein